MRLLLTLLLTTHLLALWLKFDGTADETVESSATDSDGNIDIGGYSTSPTLVMYNENGGEVSQSQLIVTATKEGFVVKYGADGQLTWKVGIVGTGDESAREVVDYAQGPMHRAPVGFCLSTSRSQRSWRLIMKIVCQKS